ncbi:MAG: methylated-DNA-[protein]-cysteine S-methyltransferase [Frankiaceae bacterium]|jgi:methylated-DNA-[protein]-cysteine S-methyltransferase|nr:methylated-DNA-[protein]-cysteine S-methyltransferase [Frankiaceae bacterium]
MADIESLLKAGPPDTGVPSRAVDAFLGAATEAGLVDVAVAPVDAPFGRLFVAVTPRGVVRVSYDDHDALLADLARRVSPRVLDAAGPTDAVRRELDAYFAGRLTRFEVPLDLSLVRTEFQRRVLAAAGRIPYGGRRTYTDVATEAGNARAVRAAGTALGRNPLCIVVPCHRVLPAGGGIGGYAGGGAAKRWLLDRESPQPGTLRR